MVYTIEGAQSQYEWHCFLLVPRFIWLQGFLTSLKIELYAWSGVMIWLLVDLLWLLQLYSLAFLTVRSSVVQSGLSYCQVVSCTVWPFLLSGRQWYLRFTLLWFCPKCYSFQCFLHACCHMTYPVVTWPILLSYDLSWLLLIPFSLLNPLLPSVCFPVRLCYECQSGCFSFFITLPYIVM